MSLVDLETERTVHFHEHEILMSFNDDSDRMLFEDWWYEEGKELFKKFKTLMEEEK